MPRTSQAIVSFLTGEITPAVKGQVDTDQYPHAVNEMTNCFVEKHGGAKGRPGSYFIREMKSSAARLVPFVFAREESYILEFGDHYIRFHTQHGTLMDNGTIYKPQINVAAPIAAPYEIVSPFSQTEIRDLYWAQANDIMYICHHNHKPIELERISVLDWVIKEESFPGAPWSPPSILWIIETGALDGTTGPFQTNFVYGYDVLSENELDVFVNGDLLTLTTHYTVDLATKSITMVAAPYITLPKGTEVRISDGGATNVPGIETAPRCVVFFQERLWFGGSLAAPQTIWGSRTADFLDFSVPDTAIGQQLLPDSPIEYTIAAYTHEAIEWLSSDAVLVIGTSATEHRLSPDQYIATDRLPQVSRMTSFGGAHQMPMYMGNYTCFVQRTGRQIRTFKQTHNTVVEEYESIDMGWMASHMTEENWIKEPQYALVPDSLAFMVRQDGRLLTAMYDPSGAEDVRSIGWSMQETQGLYESLAIIPADFQDQVWTIVGRTAGIWQRNSSIEHFDKSMHLDSAIRTPAGSSATDTLTGLEHLATSVVRIVADGKIHRDLEVTPEGTLTLDYPASDVYVGLPFTKTIETVPYVDGNNQGTGKGRMGRWSEIWIELYKSARPVVNGVIPRHDDRTELHSQSLRVFDTGYDRDKLITIVQDQPVALHVVSLYGIHTVSNG